MNELKKYNLGEGITLCVAETEKFKISHLSVSFLLPLTKEWASFGALLPYLLKRGGKRGAMALERELEELYGAALVALLHKKGDCQRPNLILQFPEGRLLPEGGQLEAAVSLLTGLILDPLSAGGFDPLQLRIEKEELHDRIEAKINDKRSYAQTQLIKNMYENEPFGVDELGDIESLEKISESSLFEFYKNVLKTAPIEIFFAGSCDADVLAESLKKAFSGISREVREIPKSQLLPAGAEKEVVEEQRVSQGRLSMGFRTGITVADREFGALMLFNAIYGGTPTSKLFLNVRERLSLCYDVSSAIDKIKGLMLVSSGIKAQDRDTAQSEILSQFEAMRKGDFSEEDITEAVTIMTNALRSSQDSAILTADYTQTLISAGGGLEVDAQIAALSTVTKAEIVAVANKIVLDTVYFLKGTAEEGQN